MHTSLLRWVFTIDVLFFLFNTQTEQDIMSCCKMLYTVQHQTNATLNAPHTDTMSAETTSYEINNILTRTCCRLEGCQSVILMRSVPFKCSCLFFTVKSWKPQLKWKKKNPYAVECKIQFKDCPHLKTDSTRWLCKLLTPLVVTQIRSVFSIKMKPWSFVQKKLCSWLQANVEVVWWVLYYYKSLMLVEGHTKHLKGTPIDYMWSHQYWKYPYGHTGLRNEELLRNQHWVP